MIKQKIEQDCIEQEKGIICVSFFFIVLFINFLQKSQRFMFALNKQKVNVLSKFIISWQICQDLLSYERESSNALDYTVRICSSKFLEYKAQEVWLLKFKALLIPKIDSSYFKYLLFWFHNNPRIIPIRNKCLHE